jgi:hypothetical protein
MHDRTKGLMQNANAKRGLLKRASNVWKGFRCCSLLMTWEVESCQTFYQKTLKHANKVLS